MFESQLMQMSGSREIVIYWPGPGHFCCAKAPGLGSHFGAKALGCRGGMVTGQIDTYIKADSHVSGNRIRPKRKWTICCWRLFSMTVFIRRAPVKHNTASECIRTIAATYGCKILKLYEYDANVYGCNTNCEWHPKNTSSCSTVHYRLRYFYISLNRMF